ncbi:MAG: Unknown protein [uncultured Sulfurovum sp.]|uniref:Lipoprotein n=1 Tax=uncultured Sulfurovum sp. TaxID=269237 RepID=A0A6S6TWX2_9BACT|nr:MAG: Unknown protein [uncultured Sulfurovum sp.]
MKYILMLVSLVLLGCGNSHNLLLSTGKKPPTFFSITDKRTMDSFVFNTKKFSFIFPTSKQSDFTGIRQGWRGASSRDGHSISLSFKNGSAYHITVSTSRNILEYTERERAIENHYISYLRSNIRIDKNDKYYINRYGKENYLCTVMEYTKIKNKNSKYVGYDCHKFNQDKTKYKKVHIRLTYSKPTNPTLAKQYTYSDLKRRAKRMLDSLYIKDEW